MSSSSNIDTILFDLDGTLVDTELAAARAIRSCFEGWSVAIDERDAAYIAGRTWAAAAEFLFGKYRLPVPRAEAAAKMVEAYRELLERDLPIVPGGADCVRALAAHGLRLGLVSGSNRAEILWALDKLGVRERFEVILGAEDYPKSKPAPDGYAKALAILGREASRTLVFEDSNAGISSALTVGTWVVAITSTNHFKQDNSRAHERIEDLRGIDGAWIDRFAERARGRT